MSTRCNIKVKDSSAELLFYRHSNGYPSGALPLLNKFLNYVKSGIIRDNVGQACGWLIILGANEYDYSSELSTFGQPKNSLLKEYKPEDTMSGWKVGSIEPTICTHSDIEFVYTIDLEKQTIKASNLDFIIDVTNIDVDIVDAIFNELEEKTPDDVSKKYNIEILID